jgi:cellobiose phosphorylase
MYRLIVESLLGFRREGDVLRIAPCLPADWAGFKLRYRHGSTLYHIDVRTAAGRASENCTIALVDDRREHRIEVTIGSGPEASLDPGLPRPNDQKELQIAK